MINYQIMPLPFQQIAEVYRPRRLIESLLPADVVQVVQRLHPLLALEQHEDAGEAAVPVVLLLVVGHVVLDHRHFSTHRSDN